MCSIEQHPVPLAPLPGHASVNNSPNHLYPYFPNPNFNPYLTSCPENYQDFIPPKNCPARPVLSGVISFTQPTAASTSATRTTIDHTRALLAYQENQISPSILRRKSSACGSLSLKLNTPNVIFPLTDPYHRSDQSHSLSSDFENTVHAVANIIDHKLYKAMYSTLEEYFKSVWKISRSQVYRIMTCDKVLQQLSNFPVRPQSERLCRVLHRTTASTPERLNDLWREVLRMVSLNRIYRIKSTVEAEWKDLEDITPKLVERVWKIMEEGLTKRKHEDDDEVIVKCEQPTPKVFIDSPDVTIASSLPQLSDIPRLDLSNISCSNSPLTTPATSPALNNFPGVTGEITNPNYFQFECSPYLSSSPSLGGNSPYLPTPVELTFDLPTDATLTEFQSPLIPKSNQDTLTPTNGFDSSLTKKSETGLENDTWEPTWNDSLVYQTSDYPFCLDMDALSKLTMSISPSNSSFDPTSKDCCNNSENAIDNKSNRRNDTIQSDTANIDSHFNEHCNLIAQSSVIKPPTEADGVVSPVSPQNSNTNVTNTSPIDNQCSKTSTNYSKPPVYIEIEFSTSPDSTEIAKAHSGPTIVRSPNLGTGCSHVMRPQIKSYFSCAETEGYICTLENL